MRVSSDSRHPLYWGLFFVAPPQVFLDGREYQHEYILEADTDKGEITVAKMNGSHPIHAGNQFVTEKVHGLVEIKGQFKAHKPEGLSP